MLKAKGVLAHDFAKTIPACSLYIYTTSIHLSEKRANGAEKRNLPRFGRTSGAFERNAAQLCVSAELRHCLVWARVAGRLTRCAAD